MYEFLETDPECWASRLLKAEAIALGWDPESMTLRRWVEVRPPPLRRAARAVREPPELVSAAVDCSRSFVEMMRRWENGEMVATVDLRGVDLRRFIDEDDILEDDLRDFVSNQMELESGDDWDTDDYRDDYIDTDYSDSEEDFDRDTLEERLFDALCERIQGIIDDE